MLSLMNTNWDTSQEIKMSNATENRDLIAKTNCYSDDQDCARVKGNGS